MTLLFNSDHVIYNVSIFPLLQEMFDFLDDHVAKIVDPVQKERYKRAVDHTKRKYNFQARTEWFLNCISSHFCNWKHSGTQIKSPQSRL